MNIATNTRAFLTTEEAMKRLDWSDDGLVHCVSNPAPCVLVGADWNILSVETYFRKHGVEESGPNATKGGYGVCSRDGQRWLFFKTKGATNGG